MGRAATYRESTETLAYVRKVYAWLLFGVALCSGAAGLALNVGTPVETTFEKQTVTVPPIVAAVIEHPMAAGFLFIGLALAAAFARRAQGMMVPLYVFFTAFSGIFIGPAIFVAQLTASKGHTLSGHPLRDALILTFMAFGSLTGYVFASRKDFSSWGSFLMTGLWVLIGAMFLAIFLGSNALNLAISSIAVLLFAGFMVFDTWAILNKSDYDDPIGDALNLFLDLLNMFINLLSILSSKK